ncbi:hypothetical protein SAMN00120144_2302 [Hymenobacter roseosalivarius DSM 11622]|uniref:Uncharacterized protein n=1 Tax=Hymenobacter roseosalivarius DSM 11622 TaxID=645990 RepID=A0A1W1VX58_9BACT|nr:DUF6370 family protein [Hymenobacter roseosalivarius]SMB97969.1 hypothetical protein SAMN00120144_2302 [Hymenobacter roseosalivarius DSM 11622]
MKSLFLLLTFGFFAASTAQAQTTKAAASVAAAPDKAKEVMVADAACGQCKLGLPGKSCDLAVRLGGKSYFLTGRILTPTATLTPTTGFATLSAKRRYRAK